jgi:hypothetical protein
MVFKVEMNSAMHGLKNVAAFGSLGLPSHPYREARFDPAAIRLTPGQYSPSRAKGKRLGATS